MRDRYANLREGLVGAWCPSIRGSGFTLPDLSGYGNHGTLTNMAADDWVSSQYGRALDFDGTDDFVSINKTPSARFFATDFSISFWYQARVNSGGYRLFWETQGYRAQTGGLAIYQNNAQVEVWKHTTGVGFTNMINVAGGVGLNVWKHLALIRQSGTLALYLDGSSQGTFSDNQDYDVDNLTNQFNFGGGRTAFYFLGLMDSLLTHNRALARSEIRILASRPGIGLVPQRRVVYDAPKTRRRNHALIGNMF